MATACRPGRIHYWKLEPTGPRVRGVCQNCAQKREFNNSFDDLSKWEAYPMVFGNMNRIEDDE